MTLTLILGGLVAVLAFVNLWQARRNGRLKKERDDALATIDAKDSQLRAAINAKPGDGVDSLRDHTF